MRKLVFLFLLLGLSVNLRAKEVVTVMTYNVENLFDTTHDEGKDDYTYLPLVVKNRSRKIQEHCKLISNPRWRDECLNLDWNSELLEKKIHHIARVLKSVNDGMGADIVVVQEVENKNVLTMLRDIGLADMGYTEVILLEGPDRRGIDVGILSKIKLASPPKLHIVDLSSVLSKQGKRKGLNANKTKLTRGILEATFGRNGARFTVFGNHWSSPGNVAQTRYIAAQTLYRAVAKKNHPVLAMGDFNTLKKDRPHGINEILLNRTRKSAFYDAQKVSSDELGRAFDFIDGGRGSHWYRGKWSFLDRVFFMKRMVDKNCKDSQNCIYPKWNSFEVVKRSFMLRENRNEGNFPLGQLIPWRFNFKTGQGYSDHLPLFISFEI